MELELEPLDLGLLKYELDTIILDAGTKSTVEGMAEGIITVANLRGILIELNHILHDSVSIIHLEMFKGIFSISNGIERTKVVSEFIEKCGIGVLLCQQIPQIRMEDGGCKPVKSSARKEGDSILDFAGICCKSSGSVIKVQLEGDNKSLEFLQVRTIKSVQFFDLGTDGVRSRIV